MKGYFKLWCHGIAAHAQYFFFDVAIEGSETAAFEKAMRRWRPDMCFARWGDDRVKSCQRYPGVPRVYNPESTEEVFFAKSVIAALARTLEYAA